MASQGKGIQMARIAWKDLELTLSQWLVRWEAQILFDGSIDDVIFKNFWMTIATQVLSMRTHINMITGDFAPASNAASPFFESFQFDLSSLKQSFKLFGWNLCNNLRSANTVRLQLTKQNAPQRHPPKSISPLDCLPTELLFSIFSFVVDRWTTATYRLLRISRRTQPIIRHLLCRKPPDVRSYKDVDRLLRYLTIYPTCGPSVKHLRIALKNSDMSVALNSSLDLTTLMGGFSLAKLCYLCKNVRTLTFWTPFHFRCDPGQNSPNINRTFGFLALRHIQVFNDEPGFLVSLLQKYPHISKLEVLQGDGDRDWFGDFEPYDAWYPRYWYSRQSRRTTIKDALPNSPLLPSELTSILMTQYEEDANLTTIPDIIVHDLRLASHFPPLQVLELTLFCHKPDELLFPLLKKIKGSIKSLRLAGNKHSIDPLLTHSGQRSSLCYQFYALLVECRNLEFLGLTTLRLAAWDHGLTGYLTPALRTLMLDRITGTSADFGLWLSTIVSASLPLSTVRTHFLTDEEPRFPGSDQDVQRWQTIFQSHGVKFTQTYDYCFDPDDDMD
ncbi:hypothetical protein BT69DRAFT_227690 [Atractiella rhizophila]|nr:hypothetical protein BT69DRAFT_227690 [Atractiella rhizophila]